MTSFKLFGTTSSNDKGDIKTFLNMASRSGTLAICG